MELVVDNIKTVGSCYTVEITGSLDGTPFGVRTEIGRDRQIYYGKGFTYRIEDEILSADRFCDAFFDRYESYLAFEDELVEKIYGRLEFDDMQKIFPTFDDVESLMFRHDLKFVHSKNLHAEDMALYTRRYEPTSCCERYVYVPKTNDVNQNKAIIETISRFIDGAFEQEITEHDAMQLCAAKGYRLSAGEDVDYRNYWSLYQLDGVDKIQLVSQFETLQEVVLYVER